jgi:predicted secreted protein
MLPPPGEAAGEPAGSSTRLAYRVAVGTEERMTSRTMLRLAAALVVSFLASAACGAGSDDVQTFDRDDRAIDVRAGDRFRIALAENPSVGDDWRLTVAPDESVARLVDEDYVSDTDEDVAGAGGTRFFVFEALSPGATELTIFNCYRCLAADQPRLEDEPFAETLEFSVRVS